MASLTSSVQQNCRICGATNTSSPVILYERMFGSREPFEYFTCLECDTMQIGDVPADLGRHYPESYYSFGTAKPLSLAKRLLRKILVRSYAGRAGGGVNVSFMERFKRRVPAWMIAVPGLRASTSILDVGSGGGERLDYLASCGYARLEGVDPFLQASGRKANGIMLHKGELADLQQRYDLITMHHSLEHMPDPAAVLAAARKRLSPGGHVVVRIPLRQGYVWRTYGHDWVHLDPPRHLFLFTAKGFIELAQRHGFKVVHSGFDSIDFSLAGSELYKKGMALFETDNAHYSTRFSQNEMAAFSAKVTELNQTGDADSGYFILKATN